MILLGILLLVLGLLFGLSILTDIGIVLLIIGVVLWAMGAAGRPVAGRRWYY